MVWITMLAMADQDGHVEASVGGLTRRANVTREECEQALSVLSSPDPDDKSGVDDGRRIRKVGRGWSITNHRQYREMRTRKQIEGAQRVRKHRAKGVTCNDVTSDNAPSASAAAFVSEGGAGETLSAADLRRPMTAAWQPSAETIASLRTGMIPDYAHPELVGRFRSHFVGAAHDIATDVEWNQRCSKWVWRDWNNPSKRPKKPEASEKGEDAGDDWVPLPAASGAKK
ncbi:MAG: DnaT-like ssDNA-binding domain-containing protein [Myxococcales bacterium]